MEGRQHTLPNSYVGGPQAHDRDRRPSAIKLPCFVAHVIGPDLDLILPSQKFAGASQHQTARHHTKTLRRNAQNAERWVSTLSDNPS